MRYRLFLAVAALSLPLSVWSAACAVDPLARYTRLGGDPNDLHLHLRADTSQGTFDRSEFSGSVVVDRGDKHLFAPKITYLRNEHRLKADKGVTLGMTNAAIRGEGGSYRISEDVVNFINGDYYLLGKTSSFKGSADNLSFNRKTRIDTFEHMTYTTCARADPLWRIEARTMVLDHNASRGVASNMTFRIGDTPVFWLPYFRFPLNNERASGFLVPSLASSNSRGLELNIPYYWNIAPNQDATFTFHPMTRRGFMFEGQYRYLGEKQKGQLEGAWLPSDKADDEDARWRIGAEHSYRFNPHWHTRINYQEVSDIDYLNDISGGLNLYDDWYLERYAALYGKENWGELTLKVQDYERVSPNVSENARPYSRLPQLTYRKTWRADGFTFAVDNEAVHFTKDGVGAAGRYHSNIALSYRSSGSFGFIEPKVSLDTTHYDYNDLKLEYGVLNGDKNRVLPTLSLDSGLIFERDINLVGTHYTQTLEPRLFYLYTPYRDQSEIPLFDTSSSSKSWNWLFARNRFTGRDRIGDTNQLTTALTSRFYRSDDGQEKARIAVGQIQYFQKRQVGLSDEPINYPVSRSVLVSEGAYQIDRHWQLYGLSFWDPNKQLNSRDIFDLRYHLDADRYLSIGHRYNREDYDQLSIGGGWRIGSDWRIFARHDYSLSLNRGFNTVLGIEHDDCCLAWRLVGRRYRNDISAKKADNAVYLEFIFKGLGNLGSSTRKVLSDALPQFRPLAEEKTF